MKVIETGSGVLTTAGDLRPRIKTVVHAVGPIYDEKKAKKDPQYDDQQAKLLSDAYRTGLDVVTNPQGHPTVISAQIKDPQPMRTIGFPSISTGIYDFPLDLAAKTALETVKTFIEENPDALDEVRFVFLPLTKDKKTPAAYAAALNSL